MGLFMTLAAVAAPLDDVNRTLRTLGTKIEGFEGAGAMERATERILIFFDDYTSHGSTACRMLSAKLECPVFHIHVHDGDLWMYNFFVAGEEVDRFNPRPGYWAPVSDDELASWQGNAETIAAHWPDLDAADVANYLVRVTDDTDFDAKAYPTDSSTIGNCWQFIDFTAKLGITYPDGEEFEECDEDE